MAKRKGALALVGGARPKLCKPRRREWTKEKRERFLATLAATCNVSAAARAIRMHSDTVYALRRRDARFRAEWAEALREGYAKLELMLLERMMNGTITTRTRPDGSTDRTHEYPNAIALQLLRLHKDSASHASIEQEEAVDAEELRERIARRIERLREREQQKGAADPSEGEQE